MRMRDLIDIVEGRLDELSTDLVQKAHTQRREQLTHLANKGLKKPTVADLGNAKPSRDTINDYHDMENAEIKRNASYRDRRGADTTAIIRDEEKQKAENERNRSRNMARGKALGVSQRKMKGTTKPKE